MSATEVVTQYDQLKSDRGVWESHWQEISDQIYPRRSDFQTKRADGEKRMTRVFDSSPILSNELLASGLLSLLVSPASKWFGMPLNLPEDQQRWIAGVVDIMFDEINVSDAGFYTAMHEAFLEYGSFGTTGIFITDRDGDGIRFQSRPLSELVVAENDKGLIDTVLRKFQWTVKQVIDRWPDSASSDVKKRFADGKLTDKIFIIHKIAPRSDRKQGKKTRNNLPIQSVYVEAATKKILEDGGFEEWPIPVGRFYKSPMEVYGRSPGMTALPDVKMLNEIMKTTIKAAQKSVDPPIAVANDGFLNPIRTVPGGVNVFDGQIEPGKLFAQLPSANPGIGLDFVTMLQDKIRSIFFVDQLQFAGGPQMTATEVIQRQEEKLRLMGPILGRAQTELLGPILDRVFGILMRQGKFEQPPEDLAAFEFTYTSPLSQAQRQQEATGFLRAVEVMTPLLQLQPNLLIDNINGDETMRDTLKMFGFDPNKLSDEDDRDQIRELQAENAQLQQTVANVQAGAEAGKAVNEAQQ